MINQDTIVFMARETGMPSLSLIDIGYLEKFAALVATAVEDKLADMIGSCDPRSTPKGIAAAIRARSKE